VRAILSTLWPYLRRHRWQAIVAVSAMMGEVVTALLSPWPLKFIFDSVLFRRSKGHLVLRVAVSDDVLRPLLLVIAAVLAIALFDALFTYVDGRYSELVAQQSIYELRLGLFSHLQKQSLSYHQHRDTRVGDLLSRLSGDVQTLEDLAADGTSNLITNGVVVVAMIVVLFWFDWRLATCSLLFTIPMFFLARSTTTQMRLAMRTARRQEGQVSAVLEESLSAIKLVQAYGREAYEERRLAFQSSQSLQAKLKAAMVQARLGPYLTVVSAIGVSSLSAFGVLLVLHQKLTPGELLIAVGYLKGMQSPIRQLAKLSFAVGKASAGVERVRETFSLAPQVQERPNAQELDGAFGDVRFDKVSFGYRDEEAVLHGVTLDVKRGTTVALVGATGSGKTTLLSLLPRFYDPWSGRVLLDGIDVRDLTLSSLRAQIAMVLQESLIFRTTVRENIAYGRPDATEEEIELAAEVSGVAAIARSLEDGLDTVVSERGSSLSGGQRQCIGIARALLKDAPIVILDEPTSSMDSRTEHLVMTGLQRLTAGRTVLVIAHRLATVQNADSVALLRGGRIVEQGKPSELLRRRSEFADLVALQSFPLPTGRRHRDMA